MYVSDQGHFSVGRALDELGFPVDTLVTLPSDDRFRLGPGPLAAAVTADRGRGLMPFAVVAVAGTTNTGSIDDVPGIAAVATLHEVDQLDGAAVADLAQRLGVDLVVVGPEAPLVAGVADAVTDRGIACFGPSGEAARLEGASALTTWWRVGLPLVTATTTAIAAVAFVFHWGNYLDALLYAQSEETRTLPLGIGELITLDGVEQSVLFAGAAVLALPAVLALVAVQRPLLGLQDRRHRAS